MANMQIHPSVIMAISEHHTRTRAIKQQPEIVIGALLGRKTDHSVEIVDSFELRYTKSVTLFPDTDTTSTAGKENQPSIVFDRDFYQKITPLVKQVYADLDLIGWYSTTLESVSTKETDILLHRQISEFVPNPIFLKLDPHKRETDHKISGSLPLNVYEPVIEIDSAGESLNFIEVGWSIVTEDVEIIGLEHNAKMTHVTAVPSAAVDNLRLQYNAVKMLRDRIKVISKFVKDVQSGVLPYLEEPMTDIAKLTHRFPIMNSEQYIQAYNIQCNDVALNTYLGILTKGSMSKMHIGVPLLKTRAFSTGHARR